MPLSLDSSADRQYNLLTMPNAAATDLILWDCLCDELDLVLPLPARVPNVAIYEAQAIVIRDRIEHMTASTVRPGRVLS